MARRAGATGWGRRGTARSPACPTRSSTGATGTPAPARRGDQLVPVAGRDGVADGALQLGAPPASFVEAEACSVFQSELAAEDGPEVLLVDDPERHLPAVGRGEEAVPGYRSGRALAPAPPAARRRPDPSTWPSRRSWRRRGRSLLRSCRGRGRRHRSRRRRSARPPGRPSAGAGWWRDAALGGQRPAPRLVVHVVAREAGARSCCP